MPQNTISAAGYRILQLRQIRLEMLPNFRGDLVIGQLDHDFDGKDVLFHPLMLETFCHLTLGFAGTKSQDGVCAVNNRADRIVKVAGLIPKLPELYIFRRAAFGGGPTGKAEVYFHVFKRGSGNRILGPLHSSSQSCVEFRHG